MKPPAPFITGFGIGFGIGLIACWQTPVATITRIGMGFVMLIAAAGFLFGVAALIDLACRVFKLSRLFTAFMWQRHQQEKRSEETDQD